MKIALDYDRCYNVDKEFWNKVVDLAKEHNHDIRIVTARSPVDDVLDKDRVPDIPVIYCDGIAKRFFCHWFVDKTSAEDRGWDPDVWIDDKPQGIDSNSNATKEILAEWRKSEEYLK